MSSADTYFSELKVHEMPVSMLEAMWYYAGLPSRPRLVYRTGATPWERPTGPEAYPKQRELRPVFDYKLSTLWGDLGPKVWELLDSQGVLWTSIDVVRFIDAPRFNVEEKVKDIEPVVLWIGVAPGTLPKEDARTSANGCLELLKEFGITDIDVEYRESIYTRSAGSDLLKHVREWDGTVDIRHPLTPGLGLPIAAQNTPHVEGTGGLYFAEGGSSDKVFLLTARHVLFPPNEGLNVDYAYTKTSVSRRNVLLCGTEAFDKLRKSIKSGIEGCSINADYYERCMVEEQARAAGKGKDVDEDIEALRAAAEKEKKAENDLKEFDDEVWKGWTSPRKRIFGHIVRSPPVAFNAGVEGFTEDYAIVELDTPKFKKAFKGNVMYLGTMFPTNKFMGVTFRKDGARAFKLPPWRLLKLQDILSEDLMHNPDMVDHNREPCLLVIKNSNATGVTVGRANGIFSYVREYFGNNTHWTSKEWAILPYAYDHKPGEFSAPGDSGSIIVDSLGRIGGLLTGSTGKREDSDITYATPFFWLFQRIKENGFPNAHLNPTIP